MIMVFSSSIDDCDSMLTTVPCTKITEIQRPLDYSPPPYSNNNNNRFKHDIIGWSPDIYGNNVQKFASGDFGGQQQYYTKTLKQQQQLQETPKRTKTMAPKVNGSYEQNLPTKIRSHPKAAVFQKTELPSSFAVKANISSSPLPVYQLKANPLHRGTFYKPAFQSIQKLDSHELEHAILTTPNNSPRISISHSSCNSGTVKAVNLATGAAIQKTLSSISISTHSEISNEKAPPSLEEESIRMMKLRNKWQQNVSPSSSASSTSYVTSPSSQTSEGNDDDKYNEAWNEVDKEIGNLQKLFSENDNIGYENSYLNNDEFQYQPQRLQNYAPISKTLTTEEKYYGDFDKEEESEMQFIQASEPSEFEKNVQFRNWFEKYFKGRYDINGPIGLWLQMMTDESNYQQQQQQQQRHRHQYHFNDDDIIQEEKNETDVTRVEKEKSFDDKTVVAEDEEKALQILERCETVLKQLEIVTAVPTKKHQKHEKHGLQRNLRTFNEFEIKCESHQQRHRYRYRYHVKNNNTIEEEKNETDVTRVEKEKSFDDKTVVAEDEEKALQILETCESVLKQLEIVTAVPTKKHQKHQKHKKHGLQRNLARINKYEIDCESTTPRAASSTFGYEESFDIIRY